LQGFLADITLLLLLILFFGIQQRARRQTCFRFWFVGWILVLLSYLAWEFRPHLPVNTGWQECARIDLVMLGLLAFALSFQSHRLRVQQSLSLGAGIALPACLAINLHVLYPAPAKILFGMIVALIVGAHIAGVVAIAIDLPRRMRWQRILLYVVCGVSALLMSAAFINNPQCDLADMATAELCLCTAVLYATAYGRRSLAGMAGAVGFCAWGLFYLGNAYLVGPTITNLLNIFWSFPKYFVGFSMILRVFEESAEEKSQLAEKFRAMYEDFHALYATHPHPMWIYDHETGRFLSANPAAEKHYGYTEAEFRDMRIQQLDGPGTDVDPHPLPVSAEGHQTQHRRKDGSLAWVHVTDRPVVFNGNDARVLLARDITDRVQLDRELAFRANHDALTGLPNRTLLQERVLQCLDLADREDKRAALLAIDVDHFKRINDTYGHVIGDACLQAVAQRLKSRIRKMDTLARTGGEEFTAIIGGLSHPDDAEKIATSLLHAFETPLELEECAERVTVSIGVALYPDDGQTPDALRRLSDDALYQAKRHGRNRAAYAWEQLAVLDFQSKMDTAS
jgi:diguanylate cyclase (GGDEF)-like protein/PAS domain S-box-containing protein